MIELLNVTKKVPNKSILNGISCRIERGLTVIVGDSGAGKSTLLNAIATIDNISSGQIYYSMNNWEFYYSADTTEEELIDFRRKHLSIIFQNANLLGDLDPYQNIELSLNIAGIPVEKKAVIEKLTLLGLQEVTNKSVSLLSGGERQRVAIARALARGTEIILADEPTGNLDAKNTEEVFSILKELSEDRIIVVVSHNQEMAQKYADHIICIQDGEIKDDNYIYCKKAVNNEENTHNIEGSAKTPPCISWATTKLLSRKSIKKFKLKFISMVFVTAIAFACVAVLSTLTKMVDDKINDINYTYYDADVVDVCPKYDNELTPQLIVMASEGLPLYGKDIDFFERRDEFSEVVPVNTNDFHVGDSTAPINIKSIKLDQFFIDRIMTEVIEGDFPSTSREIIIGEDLSILLFDGKGIGEVINIFDDYGNNIEFKIVGINHAKNIDGIFYNYVPYQSLIDIHYESFLSELFLASAMNDSTTFSSITCGYLQSEFNADTIVWGSTPTNPQEIVISVDMLRDLYFSIYNEYSHFTAQDILDNNDNIHSIIESVVAKEYYLSANDSYTISIVGIHDGGSSDIYIDPSWKTTITQVLPHLIQCYCSSMDIARDFNGDNISSKYSFEAYYIERFSTAVENNNLWRLILVSCSILLFIVAFILANSYARIIITERLYEIGIIKSMGGSKSDIARLLVCEQLHLGVSAGVVAVVLYLLSLVIIPRTYHLSLRNPIIAVYTVALLFVGTVILCVLLCFSKIIAVAKSKPIEDMRK